MIASQKDGKIIFQSVMVRVNRVSWSPENEINQYLNASDELSLLRLWFLFKESKERLRVKMRNFQIQFQWKVYAFNNLTFTIQ